MRRATLVVLIAVTTTAIVAPAGAQSFLDRVNAKLNKLGGSPQSTASPLLAPITPAQSATIDRLLAEPI